MSALIRVRSSNLQAVDYDLEFHLLTVAFKSGSKYEFEDVPPHVFRRICNARSKGRAFNKLVRPTYVYRRIR